MPAHSTGIRTPQHPHQRRHLRSGFNFTDPDTATLLRLPSSAIHSRRAEIIISRPIMVAAGSVTHRMIMFRHQHHRDCYHHLIRNRIEECAKAGALVPATRQITVKPVRHGSDQENKRTGKRRPDDRQVKCGTKNGMSTTRKRVSNVGILNRMMTVTVCCQ